jgi:hypothetical protein
LTAEGALNVLWIKFEVSPWSESGTSRSSGDIREIIVNDNSCTISTTVEDTTTHHWRSYSMFILPLQEGDDVKRFYFYISCGEDFNAVLDSFE